MKLLRQTDMPVMPWKNGHGTTTEVAISPFGATLASGFDWRISSANVLESGPFSLFEDYDRILTVWRGDEMTLQMPGRNDIVMKPFEAHRFRGDQNVTAKLENPVQDLGVIFRRDSVDAIMSVLPVPAGAAMMISFDDEFDSHVLFIVQGTIGIRNVSKQNVLANEGDAVLFDHDEGRRVFRGRSSVVLTSGEAACAILVALKTKPLA